MPFSNKKEEERTEQAFSNPRIGDRFTEMYSFWLYVVGRNGDKIATLEASPPCSFPEDGIFKVQTVKEFKNRFSYGSIPGYWVHFVDSNNDVKGWLEEGFWKVT